MIQQGVRALASKQDAGEDPWGPTLAKVLPAPHPATIPPSHNPMVAACFEREAGRRTEGRGTALQGRSLGVQEPSSGRAASHTALCYTPSLISKARHLPWAACLTRNTRHPQTRENVSFCLNQLGWHLRGREDPDDKYKSELQVCAPRASSSFSFFIDHFSYTPVNDAAGKCPGSPSW